MIEFHDRLPNEPGYYWMRPKEWIDDFTECQIVVVVSALDRWEFNMYGRSKLAGSLVLTGFAWGGQTGSGWRFVSEMEDMLFSQRIKEPDTTGFQSWPI